MNAFAMWNLLSDAAIKATVVLLAAAILTLAMRRASAAMRHLVWTSATAMTLLLPIGMAVVPTCRIPLPVWRGTSSPLVQAISLPAINSPIDRKSDTQATAMVSPESRQQTVPIEQSSVRAPIQTVVSAKSISHPPAQLPRIALSIWFIGLVLVATYWVIGLFAAGKMRRLTTHVVAGRSFDALQDAQRQLGLRRTVQLRVGPNLAMPLTAGTWQPRVFLPQAAETWSDEQLQSAMLHELAHVKRFDCAAQWLTNWACAVYWFNPLVWVAAARLRMERERACDDLTLNHGATPASYADHLLSVAKALRAGPRMRTCAVAMARVSGLRQRLNDILDGRINRQEVSMRIIVITLAVTLATLVSLSCVKFQSQANAAPPPTAASITASTNPPSTKPTTMRARLANQPVVPLRLTVLDSATSKPISDAAIVFDSQLGDLAKRTDDQGHADIFFGGVVNPTMTIARDQYIGHLIRWQQKVPKGEYTVLLDHTVSIGGKVVDDAGQPIVGANIEIWIHGTASSKDGVFTEIPWINRAVKTDANGQWTFDRVSPHAPSIQVAAWDYQHLDSAYFILKDYSPASALRDKTSVLTLSRGVKVSGTVVEPYFGAPVPNAKVYFGDTQSASNQVPPLVTDKEGHFEFAAKPGIGLTLSATSAGYKTQVLQQMVEPQPMKLEFRLTPVHVQ